MGLLDGVDDPRQCGVIGRCRDFVFQGAGLVNGAGEDFIAHGFFNRQAFPGDRRLVDGGLTCGDFTVQADALAGFNPDDGAQFDAFNLLLNPVTVGLLHRGLFRVICIKPLMALRARSRDRLQSTRRTVNRNITIAGFRRLADQDRARHGDTH